MNSQSHLSMMKKIIQTCFYVCVSFTLTIGQYVQADYKTTITYYINDAQGSPVIATNEKGEVIWQETYKPFGERIFKKKESKQQKTWYTSKIEDRDLELSYYGARYYDPLVGRFMGIDPVGFREGMIETTFNKYSYANNNPYKYVDPNGEFWVTMTYNNKTLKPYEKNQIAGMGNAAMEFGVYTPTAVVAGITAYEFLPEYAIVSAEIGFLSNNDAPGRNKTTKRTVATSDITNLKNIKSAGDIFKNPNLLRGLEQNPALVFSKLKNTTGWKLERLGKGSHKGQGWIMRQYKGDNPTDKMIQWHPGGGRHGKSPYFKVSSGETGTVRVGSQF